MNELDPKTKALEVYNQMKGFGVTNKHQKSTAKKSVKNTISVIDKIILQMVDHTIQSKIREHLNYWNEVLTEIEKI